MVFSRDVVESFQNALALHPDVLRAWQSRDEAWNGVVTQALLAASTVEVPSGYRFTRMSPEGSRAVALSVDVAAQQEEWGAPAFLAVHETAADAMAVRLSAWQLVTLEAKKRVLVAYWDPKVRGVSSLEKLVELVKEVCVAQPCKDVLLVAAPVRAHAHSAQDLAAQFRSHIVGVWTERQAAQVLGRLAS